MSDTSNDLLIERADEVLKTCGPLTKEIIERCLENFDLEGLYWTLKYVQEDSL